MEWSCWMDGKWHDPSSEFRELVSEWWHFSSWWWTQPEIGQHRGKDKESWNIFKPYLLLKNGPLLIYPSKIVTLTFHRIFVYQRVISSLLKLTKIMKTTPACSFLDRFQIGQLHRVPPFSRPCLIPGQQLLFCLPYHPISHGSHPILSPVYVDLLRRQ